jgi:CheY-like chemotaxis protein
VFLKTKPGNKMGFRYNTVLLIDDDETDNFIMERLITLSGFSENIITYEDSKSALMFFKRKRPVHVPNWVFLDINMPIVSGFHFLDEIEKLEPGYLDNMKVVILSNSINPSDVKKAKSYSRVKHFLQKPLKFSDFEKL